MNLDILPLKKSDLEMLTPGICHHRYPANLPESTTHTPRERGLGSGVSLETLALPM